MYKVLSNISGLFLGISRVGHSEPFPMAKVFKNHPEFPVFHVKPGSLIQIKIRNKSDLLSQIEGHILVPKMPRKRPAFEFS